MNSLNVAICEDNQNEAETLVTVLQQHSIPIQFTVFTNGEALLEIYHPYAFDLLLLDIYLDGMTGIETAAGVREIDADIPIAFITTSTDFTLESYRLCALMYIEKPFQPKDIDTILNLALLKKENAPALTVQRNGKAERVLCSTILYLEQQKHHVYIYRKDGTALQVYEKLSAFLPQLEGQPFFHSHKSFCVNFFYVSMIDSELRCFVMQNGNNIPIRRESVSKAKRAYEDFLFQRTRKSS